MKLLDALTAADATHLGYFLPVSERHKEEMHRQYLLKHLQAVRITDMKPPRFAYRAATDEGRSFMEARGYA